MNKMKRFVVLLLACATIANSALIVSAATSYPDGGTWNYGVGITGSYSDYLHNTKEHSATVKKGSEVDSHKVGATKWAKSRLTIYSGCNFYYNFY